MAYPKIKLDFNEEPITFGEVRGDKPGKPCMPSVMEYAKQARAYESGCKQTSQRVEGKAWGFALAYAWDQLPAFTLSTSRHTRMCDLTEMTDEDLRNCATFPQDYNFNGKDAAFITGMSVPPVMMANIAHELREQWL